MEDGSDVMNSFKCCSMCMQHCFEKHADFGRNQAEELYAAPSFFKLIKLSHLTASNILRIPVMFLERHSDNVEDSVTLRGPSGFECKVCLAYEKGHGLHLGFERFVAHHGVEAGDALVFTLIAKSTFLVKVFDRFGSQKIPVSAADSIEGLLKNSLDRRKSVLHNGDLPKRDKEESIQEGIDEESDEDAVDAFYNLRQDRLKDASELDVEIQHHNFDPASVQLTGDMSNGKGGLGEAVQQLKPSTNLQSPSHPTNDNNQDETPFDQRPTSLAQQKIVSNGNICLDSSESRSFEFAKAEQLAAVQVRTDEGRTISLVISNSVSNQQNFPQDFGYRWFREATAIDLEIETGMRYTVNYLHHVSRLQGGWSKFVKDNDLREGDICLLERVAPVLFKVEFFRIADFLCKPFTAKGGSSHLGLENGRMKSSKDLGPSTSSAIRSKLQTSPEKEYSRSNRSRNSFKDGQQLHRTAVENGTHSSNATSAALENDCTIVHLSSRRSCEILPGDFKPCPRRKRQDPEPLAVTPEASFRGEIGDVAGRSRKKPRKEVVQNVFDAADSLVQNLQHPSCKITMTKSHLFSHRNVFLDKLPLPEESSTVTLLNSKGDQSTVDWFVTPAGRRLKGLGWKQFVEDNKLAIGDVCVFEVIDSREMHIMVHVLHLADYCKPKTECEEQDSRINMQPTAMGRSMNATVERNRVTEQDTASTGFATSSENPCRSTELLSNRRRIKMKACRPTRNSSTTETRISGVLKDLNLTLAPAVPVKLEGSGASIAPVTEEPSKLRSGASELPEFPAKPSPLRNGCTQL